MIWNIDNINKILQALTNSDAMVGITSFDILFNARVNTCILSDADKIALLLLTNFWSLHPYHSLHFDEE